MCFQFFGPLIFEKSVGLGRSRHGATPLLVVTRGGNVPRDFPAKIDPTRRVVSVM